MTFFVSPASFITAKAGRRNEHLAGALCPQREGVRSWWVCGNRVARGESRFFVLIGKKYDEFEGVKSTDEFVWTTFSTMSHAFAHVAQTTGESPTTESEAWTR